MLREKMLGCGGVYLCRRKVCTMLLLMMLRANHTSMATMFLVRALEKLSLVAAAAPPGSVKLLLLCSRPSGSLEVLYSSDISSSQSEDTQTHRDHIIEY